MIEIIAAVSLTIVGLVIVALADKEFAEDDAPSFRERSIVRLFGLALWTIGILLFTK